LAWSRAAKYEKDLALRLQSELYEDLSLMRFAQWATHQDSPFEAELSVDRVRWEKIEDLRKSHFFDLEHLISYAMQVRILERWERIRMTGDPKILRELMEKVVNHD
jgi:hypothetical protein